MLCDTSALAIQASADSLKVSLDNLVTQGKMSAAAAQAAALRIVRSPDIEARIGLTHWLQYRGHDIGDCYACNAHRGHLNQIAELPAVAFQTAYCINNS